MGLLRWLVLGMAAVVAGCATAPSGFLTPTLSPRAQVLSYFPETAPLVALVRTDPANEDLAAAGDAGMLGVLQRLARAQGLVLEQIRPLLGNDMAVGLPAVGAPPLAVLVTKDAEALETLAASRVLGERAERAGTYRGADLFVAWDAAFAVRGDLLLISRTTIDLRRALDVRAETDGFDLAVLNRALPDDSGAAAVRGVGDLRAAVVRQGERARAIPLLSALQRVGFALAVDGARAHLRARVDVDGTDLVERDIPISPGDVGPRAVRDSRHPTVGVRDLAHTLGVADRAAAAALPLDHLRFSALRRALRRYARVDLVADVVGALHGPATLVLRPGGTLVRAEPSRPDRLRQALDRVARRFARAAGRTPLRSLRLRAHDGFLSLHRRGRLLTRIGMVDGVMVAGAANSRTLTRLAHRRSRRVATARGGLAFTLPGPEVRERVPLPLAAMRGWVRGGSQALELSATARLRRPPT